MNVKPCEREKPTGNKRSVRRTKTNALLINPFNLQLQIEMRRLMERVTHIDTEQQRYRRTESKTAHGSIRQRFKRESHRLLNAHILEKIEKKRNCRTDKIHWIE